MVAVVAFTAVVPIAHATFAGANGKIAYAKASGSFAIHVMNSNGSGDTSLGSGQQPSWSPDGTKIAFADAGGLSIMNADGSGRQQIVASNSDGLVSHPTWAPSGTRLAFAREKCVSDPQEFCTSMLETVNADGTGETTIQNSQNPNPLEPSWSPDSTKIAFTGRVYANNFSAGDIYTINPDGTGETRLTNTTDTEEQSPDWSPDAQKILASGEQQGGLFTMNPDGTGQTPIHGGFGGVFSPDQTRISFVDTPPATAGGVSDFEIYTMNANGTGATQLTNDPSSTYNFQPSWQPVAPGFPRPKGATPLQTYFVVAYEQCSLGNLQHGGPLASVACSPPQQSSRILTVGTLDANDQQAKSVGSLRLDVKPATTENEADVKIAFNEKDIRNKSDLSDYTGELGPVALWRITDRFNGPIAGSGGSDAATMPDVAFDFGGNGIPCAATADATIGSTCVLDTTANAVVPGVIVEGKRMNVQLGQVLVMDGGDDGDAATTADNTVFLDQGIFIP